MVQTLALTGRVAVVTGAGRGIGRACAEALAAQGAHVLLAGRQAEPLEALAAALAETQGRACATALPCDVADPAAVRDLFQRVFKDHKRLDTLVANAGVMDDALIGMVTPELIQRVFATNTFGLLHCAQYASRLMARSGGGSIVALSSIVGVEGHAGQSVYAGSKAAVLGIVQSLAQELAPQAIRVNAVAPGFIDTELTRTLPEAKRAAALARIALQRAGTPEDVAATVLFLASDMARYVTGQVIGVDGGMKI
ncbi:SDR family NAD(P)-dependent oxidoreductase [Aquabacterium sp.]|uniref:SDR family NAD(P)-dependent oxidoreductase n=1 Tax=Aquabacterium sp. TaxID=1872578 RepID=UPI0037853128